MTQEIAAMIRRIYDKAYNKGHLPVLDEIISHDYQRNQPPMKSVKGLFAYMLF